MVRVLSGVFAVLLLQNVSASALTVVNFATSFSPTGVGLMINGSAGDDVIGFLRVADEGRDSCLDRRDRRRELRNFLDIDAGSFVGRSHGIVLSTGWNDEPPRRRFPRPAA